MGFLSSIFGGASPGKNVVQTKIPEELAPYVKEALTDTQALYKQRMAEGYDPYTGQRISELTPQQQQAMTGIEGLVGTQRPLQEEALAGYRGGDERFGYDRLGGLQGDYGRIGGLDFKGTPTEFTQTQFEDKPIEEYMSPYQRAVTDIEKREAQKSLEEQVMPQFEKQAIAAGGMSGMGSRAGVQAGLLGQAQMQQLGDIEKKGLLDAYKDAQLRKEDAFRRFQDQRGFEERGREMQERERAFQKGERAFGADLEKGEREFMRGERTFDAQQFAAQKARERQRAGDIAGMAPKMFAGGLQEMGALQTVGEQRQAHQQQALDKAYADWLEESQFPEEQLARYQSSIYANPILKTPSKTTTTHAPKVGLGQQLLGLGTAALGAAIPGGGTVGGMIGKKMFSAGGGYLGGLSGLPQSRPYVNYVRKNMGGTVYRQNAGPVNDVDLDFAGPAIEPDLTNITTSTPPVSTETLGESDISKIKFSKTRDIAQIGEGKKKLSSAIGALYAADDTKSIEESNKLLKPFEDKINKLLERTNDSKARFWSILGRNIATNPSGALAGAAVGLDEALKHSNLEEKDIRKIKREVMEDLYKEKKGILKTKQAKRNLRIARKAGLLKDLEKLPEEQRKKILDEAKTLAEIRYKLAQARAEGASSGLKVGEVVKIFNTVKSNLPGFSITPQGQAYLIDEVPWGKNAGAVSIELNRILANAMRMKDAKVGSGEITTTMKELIKKFILPKREKPD